MYEKRANIKDISFQKNIQYSHSYIHLSVNYNSPNTSITSQEPRVLFTVIISLNGSLVCGGTFRLPFFQNETVCAVVRSRGGITYSTTMICQCYFYGERLFQTHNGTREGEITGRRKDTVE